VPSAKESRDGVNINKTIAQRIVNIRQGVIQTAFEEVMSVASWWAPTDRPERQDNRAAQEDANTITSERPMQGYATTTQSPSSDPTTIPFCSPYTRRHCHRWDTCHRPPSSPTNLSTSLAISARQSSAPPSARVLASTPTLLTPSST